MGYAFQVNAVRAMMVKNSRGDGWGAIRAPSHPARSIPSLAPRVTSSSSVHAEHSRRPARLVETDAHHKIQPSAYMHSNFVTALNTPRSVAPANHERTHGHVSEVTGHPDGCYPGAGASLHTTRTLTQGRLR